MLLLALTLACSTVHDDAQTDSAASDADAVVPLEPPPDGEGFQVSMAFTVPPYTESWMCAVYPLPTDAIANVNKVEYQQTPGTHHMTLSTVALSGIDLEPGLYDCDELLTPLMEDQLMFFGAQGTPEETLQLPEGVAAQLPGGIDVIHELHYVNPTDQPVEAYARVNAWTIPSSEVTEGIWGGQVRDETVHIPAASEHTEWTRCVFNQDVDVLFLAAHTHKLGIEFTIRRFDGAESGDIFFTNDDWHDPKITQYDSPLVLKAGEGFEYACTWRNPNGYPIAYGLTADDEMCNLAIVHTPMSMTAKCEVVETSDGVIWEG